MPTVLIVSGFLVLALILIFVIFLIFRYKKRRDKNLERGLSIVPLRIHLPPLSEDVEAKTRDSRDVVEENISKAVVLYNLLASTAEKQGLKTIYYGQRHMGFEIIAKGASVHFYAVAPRDLVPIIRQAINSAYKSAKVEEAAEHNLFDPEISPESVLGGELILKEDFAYPIATYIDSRQDIMKSLLGALSGMSGNDGVGIQILLRPADKTWTKRAQDVAKGLSKQQPNNNFFKDLLLSFFKAPESSDKSASAKLESLSNLDKNLIEAIEKKVAQSGFEVLIRLVVSTPTLQTSRSMRSNLLAAFSLLNAPKSNGFKYVKAKKIGKFVTDFNLRIFPQSESKNILGINEMATIFHLPDEANIPTSQLLRQMSKQVDGPRNFPDEGLLLGHNVFRGEKRRVILSDADRRRHMYVVGQTGTGKSVFLENMIIQDMLAGKGFALVDPHGETAEKILSRIPKERLDEVIYFNPANMEYPMGLNIFEHNTIDDQDILIQEAIAMLYKLYDPNRQGMMGARFEHIFRNAAKLIMADPAGGTFIDIPKLFNDRRFVEQKLQHVSDQTIIDFWRKEIVDAARSSEFGDLKNWFTAKFSAFLSNQMMRNTLGQNKSSFDFRQIMDEGKMMIINLSFGRTGELNMKLLGMLFVAKFQMAAMGRANVADSERPDFTLYVDEFQNFATDSFANILSAARKYRLALVVANQHTTQLTEEIRDSVLGNVDTGISFRINARDAEDMIKQFYSPTFEIDDLTRLPVGRAVVRTSIAGAPTIPFNMETLPPVSDYNSSAKDEIERYLLQKHGRPRAEVEKEIFDRLEVRPPRPPAGNLMPDTAAEKGFPRDLPRRQSPVSPSKSPSSNQFFDDWTRRRQALKEELSEHRERIKQEVKKQRISNTKLKTKQAKLEERLAQRIKNQAREDKESKKK